MWNGGSFLVLLFASFLIGSQCENEIYECYHWSEHDIAQIRAGRGTYETESEQCESHQGNVFTHGYNANYPNCADCWCCKPTCTGLCQAMPVFVIKHESSGKVWHPRGGSMNPSDGTDIVIHRGIHGATHFKFDQQNSHWGYIVHVGSGKVIHPRSGSMWPRNGDDLVLRSDRHADAYFEIDQTRNVIMHRGGKYTHPQHGGAIVPPVGDHVVIHSDFHFGMKFEFVSPSDPDEEVYVYGNPTIIGTWKIIHMVQEPTAEHRDNYTVKIGKSRTESTETSFKYKWEATGGINIDFLSSSVSLSLEIMLRRSSSAAWYDETTRTREIIVNPGETVVTWQFVYEVTQDDHRGVYKSNIVADTDSESNPPREVAGGFEDI